MTIFALLFLAMAWGFVKLVKIFRTVPVSYVVKQVVSLFDKTPADLAPTWIKDNIQKSQFYFIVNTRCKAMSLNNDYINFVVLDQHHQTALLRFAATAEQAGYSLEMQARASAEFISMMWEVETSRENLFTV